MVCSRSRPDHHRGRHNVIDQLCSAGWEEADYRRVGIFDDGMDVARHPEVEVVIEATGSPEAGIRHVRAAIARASTSSW